MGCFQSTNSDDVKKSKPDMKVKRNPLVTDNVYKCKVVLLGDKSVGKSSLVKRFCQNEFLDKYDVTMGVAYSQKVLSHHSDNMIRMHIWDTAGEEKFRAMTSFYYKDADAVILVYDVSDENTFRNLNYWIGELNNRVDRKDVCIIIVGNKVELPPEKIKSDFVIADDFAKRNGMKFFRTSAKTGEGVSEAFQYLVEKFVDFAENKVSKKERY